MNINLNALKEKWGKKELTIAIGKGRGFEESLHLLRTDDSEEYLSFAKGWLPVYFDKKANIRFVKVRNKDLPGLLAKNHIDVAVGSSVWFEEFSYPGATLVNELPLLKCRLSVITTHSMPVSSITSICSKFSIQAEQYIFKNKLNAKLMIMEGCHEVALSLGISDAIIDIIETGRTIQQMNFVELECIRNITHGIWASSSQADDLAGFLLQEKELQML
jgi:ATP phosphoribosyltransferase